MRCLHFIIAFLAVPSVATEAYWVGANLPWNNFGSDVGTGNFDHGWFDSALSKLKASGTNAVRFWLHADGRATPIFGADGMVTGAGGSSIASDLDSLVALTQKHGIVLQMCLWSFDMCKQDIPGATMHSDLMSDLAKTKSYIDLALSPMLAALRNATRTRGQNNVVIEVQNEPEWCMAGSCSTVECVSVADMQRFTAMVAEAVHSHDPGFAVTTGSASLKWSTSLPGGGQANYWTDAALRAAYPAGGPDAVLDFYNVHYYDWMFDPSWGYDPCREPLSYWGVDKPTVVAELPASSQHYSPSEMLRCAQANGFSGDLFWAYNDPGFPLDQALPALSNFTRAQPALTSYANLLLWLQERTERRRTTSFDSQSRDEVAHRGQAADRMRNAARPKKSAPELVHHATAAPAVAGRYDKHFSQRSFLATLGH